MTPNDRQLLYETKWMRVFRVGSNLQYESRFLFDKLEVGPSTMREMWPKMSPEERLEFARAFSAKPLITGSDAEILDLLMESDDDAISQAIAIRLPEHPARNAVLSYLLSKVENQRPRANYFQALKRLGHPGAAVTLQQIYQSENDSPSDSTEAIDFLFCCDALLALKPQQELLASVARLQSHPDDAVRRWAARIIQDFTDRGRT